MKKWLTTLLLVLSVVGAQAVAEPVKEAPTILSIPISATAPTVDGTLEEGEWLGPQIQGLFVFKEDYFDPRGGQVRLASDGKQLFLAMQTPVHPRYGAVLRTASGDEIVTNDAMEIWLGPGGDQAPQRLYQLLFDAAGNYYGQNYEVLSTRWNQNWRPKGMKVASRIQNGVWTLECSLPLDAIYAADVSQGVRIRIGRNYKLPFVQTITQPLIDNYIDPATMVQVKIGDELPVVEEPDWRKDEGGLLTLFNPYTLPLELKVNGKDVKLEAGQRRQITLPVNNEPDDKTSVDILIEAGPATIHRRTLRWKHTIKEVWEEVL